MRSRKLAPCFITPKTVWKFLILFRLVSVGLVEATSGFGLPNFAGVNPHPAQNPIPIESSENSDNPPVVTSPQNSVYNIQEEPAVAVSDVRLKHVALALRLTSQLNKRLQEGTHRPRSFERLYQPDVHQAQGRQYIGTFLRGGENQIGLTAQPDEDWEPLTIFHAVYPFEANGSDASKSGAVDSWGPPLEDYFKGLMDALDLKEGDASLELALTLIYLDRACSVETPRSNGLKPCPFCTPRTLHRLSLAAFLTAVKTIHGHNLEYYFEKLHSLLGDITFLQLQQMMEWMEGALGDPGLFVSGQQLWHWAEVWTSSFESVPASRK